MQSTAFFRSVVTRVWLLFALTIGATAVHAQSASQRGLSQQELEALGNLPAAQREALLGTLVESAENEQNEALSFPPLVLPVEEGGEGEEDLPPPQLFNDLGEPILDSEAQPVFFTDELRKILETQSPEDWLASDEPFLQQEILLEPFGYELFEGVPTTFAPATDIPVPPDYRLGPGDTIEVQLFGKENRQYSLVVSRDGTINFPRIGPINVMGETFQELKQQILDRVSEQLIGTSAAINMGALRSIRVLVVGDSSRPGSYTVSGLSTITNALFVSGGVSDVGSLRNIQLKRNDRVIRTLDLYDLLLRGDNSNDVRLESGDVIFIPTVGDTVSVGGFVKRPAIYELKNEKTVGQVIALAGGFRPDASPSDTRIERFDASQERSFLNVNLMDENEQQFPILAGDFLLVPPVLKTFRNGVELVGAFERPGVYQWRPGIRLTDVIKSTSELLPQADLHYVLIRRETYPDKRVFALQADLAEALRNPASAENLPLEPRDTLWVFDLSENRNDQINPLLEQLQLQAVPGNPYQAVISRGSLRDPGDYPFTEGMRISDLVKASGGLVESSYLLEAEITRYSVQGDKSRVQETRTINLQKALDGDPEHNLLLTPNDYLSVRRLENWENQLSILISGEVRYPGQYTFRQGDTLYSVIERAGGLTDQAFPQGSVFLREDLREREQQQLEALRKRLQNDISLLAFRSAGAVEGGGDVLETQRVGQAVLGDLDGTEAVGRLVINLPQILANPDQADNRVLLKDGDVLLIPERTQEVTVIGEVFFPTSHLFAEGLSRNDYIASSGGVTPNGAKKNIYVVKANGAVIAPTSRFFSRSQKIQAGDTIVVPLDTEKGFRLRNVANVTSIIYSLAIAAAAVNGLSD